jgi:hypothetical protein
MNPSEARQLVLQMKRLVVLGILALVAAFVLLAVVFLATGDPPSSAFWTTNLWLVALYSLFCV